jgi:hypothetical protein
MVDEFSLLKANVEFIIRITGKKWSLHICISFIQTFLDNQRC